MIVVKSVTQPFVPPLELTYMMETFRLMVNHCIRIGCQNKVTTLRKFSSLYYNELDQYSIQSKYKLTAMAQACGRLSHMKRSIKKGIKTKSPFVCKPYILYRVMDLE